MPVQPFRVLIADDSGFMRSALRRTLAEDPRLTVVGEASDGREAIAAAKLLRPDVLTLDVEMPEMTGLEALPKILALPRPPAVLMCSTLTAEGSRESLHALRLGAADVIGKATDGRGPGGAFAEELVAKVLAIAETHRRRRHAARAADGQPGTPAPSETLRKIRRRIAELDPRVILIASSTGGPPVLERLVQALPRETTVPVVIAQHMPAVFTRSLAERLDGLAGVRVKLAEHREPLLGGTVYLGEGGTVLSVRDTGGLKASVSQEAGGEMYMPSANVLISSAVRAAGGRVLAVVLTGMGQDGLTGCREAVAAGGLVLAQDETSCVVYGMPRAVSEAGLAAASLDPASLAEVVASAATPGRLAASA